MAGNSVAKVNEIYQQFIDYFGEDKVDIQDYNRQNIKICDRYLRDRCQTNDKIIFVHWPVVEVANEYDDKVEIWDLYGATILGQDGTLRLPPLFNRSTYDNIQWRSDYAHKV